MKEITRADLTAVSPNDAAKTPVDLTAFFELSLDLLSVIGFDGKHRQLNQAWEATLGYRRSELYALPFLELIVPEDRAEIEAKFDRIMTGEGLIQFGCRVMRADGSESWVSWTANAQPSEEQIYVVGRDVSTHHVREEDLRKSEEWFKALVETAPNGIVIIDGTGTIVLANEFTEKLFGYTRDEIVGQPIEILIPEALRIDHVAKRDGFIEQAQHQMVQIEADLIGQRSDGTEFPAAVGLSSLPGADGVHVSATIIDMTEQHARRNELLELNESLETRVADLQSLGHEADLISEMGEMLQASQGSDEAHRVIELFASRLFDRGAGSVGLINSSRNLAENVVTWGGSDAGENVFDPGDCWALRRGKRHLVGEDPIRVVCPHLQSVDPTHSMCLPLLAQGEVLGVLTIVASGTDESWADYGPKVQRLSATFADHLALALANLGLREMLQIQSIRDPVTGLFNRRYLEESLEREVARANRRSSSVGVIMLDIDHFKQFNDTYGHRAGDAVLVTLGDLLPKLIRGEDIPCRYGGEEFAIVLPDAALDDVVRRAEEIRKSLAEVQLTHADQDLGRVTVSSGVAAFPDHGKTPEDLILAADRALYQAKAEGRNRVVAAGN